MDNLQNHGEDWENQEGMEQCAGQTQWETYHLSAWRHKGKEWLSALWRTLASGEGPFDKSCGIGGRTQPLTKCGLVEGTHSGTVSLLILQSFLWPPIGQTHWKPKVQEGLGNSLKRWASQGHGREGWKVDLERQKRNVLVHKPLEAYTLGDRLMCIEKAVR